MATKFYTFPNDVKLRAGQVVRFLRGKGYYAFGKVEPKPVPRTKLVLAHSPNQSQRTGNDVTLVVVHDTEGSYGSAVSWLCNPKASASAHVVLNEDGTEATQLVPWDSKAWACAGFNSVSDNIELAGFASKPYPVEQLKAAAWIVAGRLRVRGLQPQHVVPRYVGDDKARGYTFHADLGSVGGGHHDPGFSPAQAALFDRLVKEAFNSL